MPLKQPLVLKENNNINGQNQRMMPFDSQLDNGQRSFLLVQFYYRVKDKMGDIVAPCCRESQELKQLKSENEYLKNKLKKTNPTPKTQKEPSNTSSRLLEYESEISKLKRELSTAAKQNEFLKNQHNHQQQDHQLQQKKRQLQQTVEQLSQRLQEMKEKNAAQERQLQKMIDRMQEEVQRSHKDKDQIEAEMKAMKEKMKIKQDELLRDAKTSEQQKKALALELRQHTTLFEKQIQAKDQRIQQLNSNIQKMEYDKAVSKISEEDLKKQEELQKQLNTINSQLQKLRYSRAQAYNKLSSIKYASFFNNSLLSDENDFKEYLSTTIEAHFSKKIVKTKFLCQYDEYNKVNIHRYIDYKYGLALVVKLTNGLFIAAFSEGPFYPKMVSKYDGLIISLSNRKVFSPLVKNQKAIVYDDYFVIFGNSEFRLKTGQKKVFSNLGVNNSYYDSKGEKVNILLGENGVREVPFLGYEFYEVIFEP